MANRPVPCSRCGCFIPDVASTLYSDDGEPMCLTCRNVLDEPRRLAGLKGRVNPLWWKALGAALASVIGLVVSALVPLGFLFLSGPAAVKGRAAFLALQADPAAREVLGSRDPLALVAAGTGAVVGGFGALLGLLLTVGRLFV